MRSKACLFLCIFLFSYFDCTLSAHNVLAIEDRFDPQLTIDSEGQQFPTTIFLNSGTTGTYARYRIQNKDGSLNISADSNTDGFIDGVFVLNKNGVIAMQDLEGTGVRNVEVNSLSLIHI